MKRQAIPDAQQLYDELNGVAHTLTLISQEGKAMPREAINKMLDSAAEHIFRISEDWMLLSEEEN